MATTCLIWQATVLAHRVFVETRQIQTLAGRYALLVAGWLQHLSDGAKRSFALF